MRTLLLLRHAKSSWDDPLLSDFDRPLAPRGRNAAPMMAAYIKEKKLVPDLVLCSSARRAIETWALVAHFLDRKIEIKVLRSIYLAPPSRILAFLQRAPDSAKRVMIIGHNPGMENLALVLSGPSSKKKALKKLAGKFPTAALAQIDFHCDHWSDVTRASGRLRRLVYPKDLD